MSVIGIIAEYNPFHNGHLYHLTESYRITGADSSLCIMGGDFLQRGLPACADKYTRAYTSCRMGVDIVIELPVLYAAGSASDFAMGAVSMLEAFHAVDYLCFGAETDDYAALDQISEILAGEPEDYRKTLKDLLKEGLSYPAAREKALTECLGSSVSDMIRMPNTILALEYMTALKKLDSNIRPILIPRKESMYHDHDLRKTISSASAIREALSQKLDISKAVPAETYEKMEPFYKAPQLNGDDMSQLLAYLIMQKKEAAADSEPIPDMNEDMMNRLLKITLPASYSEIVSYMKTRNVTQTRVQRALLHFILGINESERNTVTKKGYAHYGNLLSIREKTTLTKIIKENSTIPLISKKSDFIPDSEAAQILWSYDKKAVSLYNQMLLQKTGIRLPNELNSSVLSCPG